ncbi:hypothetical protein GWK91_02860 [Virgibacillus sp. MSP4-1]|uniref:DUF6843 domain-containing protein n=1 Tax=Virgibacillus sp. MSP4-1 TaxID=2700081 RepID=UPI0003A1A1BD|nr:hypothetical protein [Virgibacillus sp. MSP4-1]QHS21946.1 hypothetical protein GWK91_02860 [Virgibacillus sp. MSP4-1]
MKKLIFSIVTIILILILSISLYKFFVVKDPADEVYLIPDGYEGCIGIFYDFKNQEPLQIENNTITYQVPDDGIIKTSSPENIGWAYEDHSGFRQVDYYYVDNQGNRKQLNHEKYIHYGGNASTSRTLPDGTHINLSFSHLYVGKKPDNYSFKGCFRTDKELEQVLDK